MLFRHEIYWRIICSIRFMVTTEIMSIAKIYHYITHCYPPPKHTFQSPFSCFTFYNPLSPGKTQRYSAFCFLIFKWLCRNSPTFTFMKCTKLSRFLTSTELLSDILCWQIREFKTFSMHQNDNNRITLFSMTICSGTTLTFISMYMQWCWFVYKNSLFTNFLCLFH